MTATMIQKLSDGLVLRRATPEDAEPLAEFNARWLSDDGPEEPDESLAVWTRDLFTRPHPTFTPDLCTIVEDTSTGAIVSSSVFFPQTWTYEGIPFGVGRPELIATHPDYRRRGLVRLQMDTLHEWSAEMGHRMQAISGIPWFYRQFGYEMALDMQGGKHVYPANVPARKDGESEPFGVRPATHDDIPFLKKTYGAMSGRHLIACRMDEPVWEYAISGSSPGSAIRIEVNVMTHPDGRPAAFFAHYKQIWGRAIHLVNFSAAEGESWRDLAPPLMRHLMETGRAGAEGEGQPAFDKIDFRLADNHPIFRLMPASFSNPRRPYAWYIRVPDLAGFLGHIAPVLEKRLADADLDGYTSEVKVNFYSSGLKFDFKRGKLAGSTAWQPTPDDEGDIRFPDLSFLSMLCGRRSYSELNQFYADCYTYNDEFRVLMTALFPKKASNVWGIE